MKKVIIVIFGTLLFSICYGQRYEVWVNPDGFRHEAKGFYGFSNDTVLTIYSKATLFFPSRDSNIRWERISSLNIRNKSKNDIGVIIGFSIGAITSYLLLESEKKGNISLGSEYGGGALISAGIVGGGSLIGYLATCAKIKIPLNGKTPKEKNQTLRDRIVRRH